MISTQFCYQQKTSLLKVYTEIVVVNLYKTVLRELILKFCTVLVIDQPTQGYKQLLPLSLVKWIMVRFSPSSCFLFPLHSFLLFISINFMNIAIRFEQRMKVYRIIRSTAFKSDLFKFLANNNALKL